MRGGYPPVSQKWRCLFWLKSDLCDEGCYFPVNSDRKVTKGTPLKVGGLAVQKAASRVLNLLNISLLKNPTLSPSAHCVSDFVAVRLNFLMGLFRPPKSSVMLIARTRLCFAKGIKFRKIASLLACGVKAFSSGRRGTACGG